MDLGVLRIIGIALNAIGALVLAWRVKGILDALVSAQHANDYNFRALIDIINREPNQLPLVVGMSERVEEKQKRGIWLLVFGFVLIGIGNILVGASWYFE